jgi:hypothetical protein
MPSESGLVEDFDAYYRIADEPGTATLSRSGLY